MKTIKLLFTAILMMVAFGAQAQVVQVMKGGKVIKEYPASQVKSVEYKPVYYYYAGWECPKNEAELAKNGTLIGSSTTGFSYNFAEDGKGLRYTSASIFYIIIPKEMSIYDNLGTKVESDQFETKIVNWGGVDYKVCTSLDTSRTIDYLNIK